MSPYHYSVDTVNAFEAFSQSDDSASEEGVKRISKKPVAPSSPTPVAKPRAAPAAPSAPNAEGDRSTTRPRRAPRDGDVARSTGASRGARGGFAGPRGGAASGPRRERRPEGETAPQGAEGEDENNGEGRTQRRRAPYRGDAPGRVFDAKHREFDRHSGTGRGREGKKQGGGAYNWGNENEDFGAAGAPAATASAESQGWTAESSPVAFGEEGAASGEKSPDAIVAPAEPQGPKEISFSAYQAEMAAKRATLPQLQGSKAEVKADEVEKKFKSSGFVAYEKKPERVVSTSAAAVTEDEPVESKSGKKTIHLAFFGGERRGGRGGGRGGRGDGETRRGGRGDGDMRRGGRGDGEMRRGGRGDGETRRGDGERREGKRSQTSGEGAELVEGTSPVEGSAVEKPTTPVSPAQQRKNLNLADSQAFPSL